MRVGVVSSSNAAGMSNDDPILMAALHKAGHEAYLWAWDDAEVDWSSVDVALVRSTWDYFERIAEFAPWLAATSKVVRFVNAAETLTWNLDKHYLGELLDAGLPVLPTTIAGVDSLQAAVTSVWESGNSAIVKPVISGGSWGLHHLQPGEKLKPDAAQAPYLVQPFVPSIETLGELSVILLGGEVSHGIRKVPKQGDIRVQAEHGGINTVEVPSQEACELALRILRACPGIPAPLYARADFVEHEGQLMLMEMELLEPELFFALVPAAADRLAGLLS